MYALIAMLLPSLFGLKVMDYLLKGLKIKNLIFYYGILLLMSQGINNLIVLSFFDIDNSLWNALNEVSTFFSIYILISIVINILLVLMFVILIKNIKLEVEVKYEEKDEERKTNSSKRKQKNSNKNKNNRGTLFSKIENHFKKNKNK